MFCAGMVARWGLQPFIFLMGLSYGHDFVNINNGSFDFVKSGECASDMGPVNSHAAGGPRVPCLPLFPGKDPAPAFRWVSIILLLLSFCELTNPIASISIQTSNVTS